MKQERRMTGLLIAAMAMLVTHGPGDAWAQASWRPDRAVEIILPTAAGGANDNMARLIQKALQANKLVITPIVVINKAGGNQTLASVYLRQNAKDPHHLLYSTSTVFTAQITGLVQQHYSDLAPIALLTTEYSVFSVASDSPIKTVRDMLDRLRTDSQSLSFGLVSRGGSNHIALSQVVKTAGIDPKRLKVIVFKTNVESYLAVAGGHIHAVASSVSAATPFVQQGKARVLGVASPQRVSGPLAQVPTLREQKLDVPLVTNWRGVFGAPGLTAAQTAFWEDAFAKMAASDEWIKPLDQADVSRHFLKGHDFAKFLEAEYQISKAVLTDLGYAKE